MEMKELDKQDRSVGHGGLREELEDNGFEVFLNEPLGVVEEDSRFVKMFGNRLVEAKAIASFMDDIIKLETPTEDVRFIKWLMDKKGFTIVKYSRGLLSPDYEFEYDVMESDDHESRGLSGARSDHTSPTVWYTKYKGKTVDGELFEKAFADVRTDVREFYDEWVDEHNKRVMKRAGIATAIGLSIIALITGLSFGLKRASNDVTHAGGGNTPDGKHNTPWSEITKAT